MENDVNFEEIFPKNLGKEVAVWVESAQNELDDRLKYYG